MLTPPEVLRKLYDRVSAFSPRPGTSEGESAISNAPKVSAESASLATVASSKDNPLAMSQQLPRLNSLAAAENAQRISDLAMQAGMSAPPPAPEQPAAPAQKKDEKAAPQPVGEQAAPPAPPTPTWIDRATDEDFASALAADTGGLARAGGVVQTAAGKTVRAIETDPTTLQNLLANPKYPVDNLVFRVQADVPTWRDLVYGNPGLTIERVPTASEQLTQRIREQKENEAAALAATEDFARPLYPEDQIEGMLRRAKDPDLSIKENDSLIKQLATAQDSATSIAEADDAIRMVLASDLDPETRQDKIKKLEAVKSRAEESAKQVPLLRARIALNNATIQSPNYMQRGHAELQQMEKDAKTPAQKHALRFFLDYNEDAVGRPRPPEDYVEKAREVDSYARQINEAKTAYEKARNTQVYNYLGQVKRLVSQDGGLAIYNIPGEEENLPLVMSAINSLQLEQAMKKPKVLAAAGALAVALGKNEQLENALDSFSAEIASGTGKDAIAKALDAEKEKPTGTELKNATPRPLLGQEETPPPQPNLYAQARAALDTPEAKSYLKRAGYSEKDIGDLLASPARIRNAITMLAPETSRDIVRRAGTISFFSPDEVKFFYAKSYPESGKQISETLKSRAVADEFGIGNAGWMKKYLDELARKQ